MEKKIKFLISAVYYLTIAAIIFLFLKYAVFVVMPFVIGFFFAAILNPAVRFLCRRFCIKQKPAAILLMAVFYATAGILTVTLAVRATALVGDFSSRLPELYREAAEPALVKMFDYINRIVERFDGAAESDISRTLYGLFDSAKNSLGEAVSGISVRAISLLSGFAAAIPRFIIELLFAIISSFFFIADYEKIIEYIKSRLPRKAIGIMSDIRDRFFVIVIKYIRSYTLIMLITFAELFLGLVLIGIENSWLYALLIAVFDALPVVGTGVIMIPWALIELLRGEVSLGVGIGLLWLTVTVVRNIIEPKIVGRQVGLHPLLTLVSMFVGTKLFGIIGLIVLPVGISIAVSVIKERNQLSSGM